MGLGLTHPVESKVLYRKGNKHLKIGGASMHGWRETMEDAHCIHLSLGENQRAAFMGIFDGHSGSTCSKYVAEKLPQNVAKANNLTDENEMRQIVLQTDEDFLQAPEFRTKDDGSAGIFTVIVHDEETNTYKLINGNVGDSRTVLAVKDDKGCFTSVACTFDHKPTDELERKRIEQAGGMVHMSRVDGQLALSRAFGDRMLKTPMYPDFPRENRKVCANPDFIVQNAKPGDFLFLACDGIYEGDIFSRESVIAWIVETLKEFPDPAVVCAKLLDEVLRRGSKDNMSAMIVFFEDGTGYQQEKTEYRPGPWHSGENDHKFQDAYASDARANGLDVPTAIRLFTEQKQAEEELARKKTEAVTNSNSSNNVNNGTSNSNMVSEDTNQGTPGNTSS